jgi:hypothetical protein
VINVRNDLSLLRSAIDDAREALNKADGEALRRCLYDARQLISRMQSEPARPDFVVKAYDENAPAVVLFWIDRAYQGDVPTEKRLKAMAHYDRLVAWQETNRDQVKKPD